MAKTLESTIAGSWYPGDAESIRTIATKWESSFGEKVKSETPNVLILPHAGWA
ncbi:MAG: AmmeMemoRadiSam system protein B [Kiritimatiellae bacterium]|nr:AmmeMemoRadiSam system protein B [Kiritimatiellia bacterium]MBR0198284.1 AmmeMemoRadiSam system protein B [Kiritimatiellia bacterium]